MALARALDGVEVPERGDDPSGAAMGMSRNDEPDEGGGSWWMLCGAEAGMVCVTGGGGGGIGLEPMGQSLTTSSLSGDKRASDPLCSPWSERFCVVSREGSVPARARERSGEFHTSIYVLVVCCCGGSESKISGGHGVARNGGDSMRRTTKF